MTTSKSISTAALVCSRRTFLRAAAFGSLALAGILGACGSLTPAQTNSGNTAARTPAANFNPDLELNLTALPAEVAVLPGALTKVWTYQAEVLKGDSAAVQAIPGSWLGPIIRARTGQRVRVYFTNRLPENQPSIVHWHGLVLPEAMDGHPRYAIAPGQTYTYEFEVKNRAGTAWFHPHPHGLTPTQVYQGLAGLFLVSDAEETALGLPSGAYDLPIVIQDRTFDSNNQLVYSGSGASAAAGTGGMGSMGGMNGMGGMMTGMMGFLGERVMVNGKPDMLLSVATRPYRLRLLNGSNARIYKLAWSSGTPLTVIGSDGGLLERPVTRSYVTLAPGERIELWADFSTLAVGTELTLESLAFEGAENPGGAGSMNGMTNTSAPALGAPMRVLTVRIDREERAPLTLPTRLSAPTWLIPTDAVNAANPRTVRITLNGMQWLLNGRLFEMETASAEETVKLGTVEQWQFVNERNPGAMMDANGMAHPLHIHGVQFQVIDRQIAPDLKAGWESLREGFVDQAWKDTALIMPGETITLLMRFTHYAGMFVYHCHNLEHENGGMMRNYRVVG